ncbi:amidase [Rhodococcus rhodochrous]|uniref:amidase n=1 Tax=Rhodococcus rhodochrous TaxID=1829 RepID=UPI000A7CFFE8|nr:amidase [Rhodococcus rhodochrous]
MTGTAALPGTDVDAPASSVATVDRCLDRITKRDNVIQAWAFLDPELARAQARARDGEHRRSALHGIPIGVKDIIDTADQPTSYGSERWEGHRPDRDAEVIRRLRQAGAVILGKTTTTEFATYRPTATRNPHNPTHSPGGSSSGSAAAVADGQVPLALGTQTAGSVLRPGAYCGVFTLKPTYGRWPFDGVLPVALTFDTVGGFARHPADLAVLDGVLADPGPERDLPATAALRVGVLRPPWADRATPAAAAMLERTVAALRDVVGDVVDIPVPEDLAALDEAHTLIMAAEASAALADRIDRPGKVSDQLTRFLADGRHAPAGAIQNARIVLRRARCFVDDAHRDVDVLLTLASTGGAPAGLTSTGDPVFNKLASTAGVPAVGLPTGTGTDHLPLGIQLIGPAHSDQSLVRLATCLTDRFGLAARCPLPEELP